VLNIDDSGKALEEPVKISGDLEITLGSRVVGTIGELLVAFGWPSCKDPVTLPSRFDKQP
jgi:hypothetical protein